MNLTDRETKKSPTLRTRIAKLSGLCVMAVVGFSCKKAAAPPEVFSGPVDLIIPEHQAYTGAYIDFGEKEDDVSVEKIEEFEKLVGKHQAIVASSSYWGELTFPTANVNMIWRHGSIPMIYWSPWDKPYEEMHGPDKFSLTNILAGQWDDYIDQWAEGARAFGQPLLVSFANEMNGSWFPWSGLFYGGGIPIPGQKDKFQGPERFKKAHRYIVDRVRAKGATNIRWVYQLMDYGYPQESWNYSDDYYPGAKYVDWLALSVYGEQFLREPWAPILPLLDWPYTEVCQLDPTKPVMLAEWGCGEFPGKGSKAQWIKEGFELMRTRFPRIKAAVFWHERWQNHDGSFSNLRVNSSEEAQAAYRKGVADMHWLDRPLLKARAAK